MSFDLTFREVFDCKRCATPCDGTSKRSFDFQADTAISEIAELELSSRLNQIDLIQAQKVHNENAHLPDIEIRKNDKVIARVEVKAQGRAFMAVNRLLPHGNLLPYETVALNRSDLVRYIKNFDLEQIPTFIVWRIKRPCIPDAWYGHNLDFLKKSFEKYGETRTFRRRSTNSDYVDGTHKGVTVNYHFSLKELLEISEIERMILDI
jgi:hypothetical protein